MSVIIHGKPSAIYANRMQRYPDEVWLIWSNKNGCWYRSNSAGYTSDVTQAGLYSRDEAARHMSDGPRKYRVTEPFPMSAVRHQILRSIEHMRAQIDECMARFACILAPDAPPPPLAPPYEGALATIGDEM